MTTTADTAPDTAGTGAAAPADPPPRRQRLVADYVEAGSGVRAKTLLLACLAANGLLEGLALTALIPALNAGFSDDSAGDGPLGAVLGLTGGADEHTIIVRSLVAFGVLGFASALATFVVGRLTIHVRYTIEADLRRRMMRALLDMSWLPFLEMRLGDITKTTLVDGSQAAVGVVSLLQGVGALIVALVFMGLALAISVTMTAFTFAFACLAVLAYRLAAAKGSAHSAELSRTTDELSRETSEIFGSFKYIRASGLVEESWTRVSALVDRYRELSFRAMVPQPLVRFLYEGGGVIFVGCFLAFSLLATSQPIGTSLVFLAVFYRLAPRVTAVNDNLYVARIVLPWYHSWRAVHATATRSAGHASGVARVPRFGAIEARAVTFSYPTRSAVLNDIDLHLRKGTCTAIVGESGSGKTTLMDVLIGLLDPQGGEVTIDGVPMARIDRDWWQRQLGLVMQDSPMFSGSVLDNVALGDPRPDPERVRRCLTLAAAQGFVDEMPETLQTQVGERGSKLSGGQRQRLALARALYRDPGLLCLDEATAALDAESETLILSAVPEIKRDRAVLVVSHRVRTLGIADHIVVLQDGRIAEEGSWEELTSGPTRFRRLVESQS